MKYEVTIASISADYINFHDANGACLDSITLDRFRQGQLEIVYLDKNKTDANDIYCSCNGPTIIADSGMFSTWKVCKRCKKEKQ